MGEHKDRDHSTEYELSSDSELRFEIESKAQKVIVELKTGFAEVFGKTQNSICDCI
jgi:N-terminal beta-sandwich domain of polyadenylation factor